MIQQIQQIQAVLIIVQIDFYKLFMFHYSLIWFKVSNITKNIVGFYSLDLLSKVYFRFLNK